MFLFCFLGLGFDALGASQNPFAVRVSGVLKIRIFSFERSRIVFAAELVPGRAENRSFAANRALSHGVNISQKRL